MRNVKHCTLEQTTYKTYEIELFCTNVSPYLFITTCSSKQKTVFRNTERHCGEFTDISEHFTKHILSRC